IYTSKFKNAYNTEVTRPTNLSIHARNLQQQDLGVVIFGCTNNTIAECHSRQLFGLPKGHISYVRNIKEGLPLFLFNYDDRRLYGIYEAAGNGKFCPESNAWSHDSKGKTSYPAQVAMRVRVWCFPLAENQFRNAIIANYYQNTPGVPGQKLHFFKFELDHAQTRVLMDMFIPSPSPPNNFWMPPAAAPTNDHGRELVLSPGWAPEFEGNDNLKSENVVKSYADKLKKNKFEEVRTRDVDAEHASSGNESSGGFDELDCQYTSPEREDYALSDKVVPVKQQQYPDQQGKILFCLVLSQHISISSSCCWVGFNFTALYPWMFKCGRKCCVLLQYLDPCIPFVYAFQK
ncbi:uncharacterized protein, partial [Miscanthus floridulus]|uniref:uncharacterized protein n=1 Tax=Miscanthus floridulus TaxID=154761 RepID=UPI00345A5C93